MLKAFVTSLDEVSESVRDQYIESDEGYTLSVDDSTYKDKIGEFRGNNIALKKRNDELLKQLKRFDNIDPEEHNNLVSQLQQMKEEQLTSSGKIDKDQLEEILSQRMGTVTKNHEAQLAALQSNLKSVTEDRDSFKTKYQNGLRTALALRAFEGKASIKPNAVADVEARINKTWRVDDDTGDLRAYNGDQPMYGQDGNPLSPDDWARSVIREASHLFEGSVGGGATGTSGNGLAKSDNFIEAGDQAAFAANLEKIAAGEVKIRSN